MARLLSISFLFLAMATVALAMGRETTRHPKLIRPRTFSVYFSSSEVPFAPLDLICDNGVYDDFDTLENFYELKEEKSKLMLGIGKMVNAKEFLQKFEDDARKAMNVGVSAGAGK